MTSYHIAGIISLALVAGCGGKQEASVPEGAEAEADAGCFIKMVFDAEPSSPDMGDRCSRIATCAVEVGQVCPGTTFVGPSSEYDCRCDGGLWDCKLSYNNWTSCPPSTAPDSGVHE